MQPHQQRVIDEKCALDEKLSKLVTFINTDTFEAVVKDIDECNRLRDQADFMLGYSQILGQRISAFQSPASKE